MYPRQVRADKEMQHAPSFSKALLSSCCSVSVLPAPWEAGTGWHAPYAEEGSECAGGSIYSTVSQSPFPSLGEEPKRQWPASGQSSTLQPTCSLRPTQLAFPISKPLFPASWVPPFPISLLSKAILLPEAEPGRSLSSGPAWWTKQEFHSNANLSLDKIQGKCVPLQLPLPLHPSLAVLCVAVNKCEATGPSM